MVADFPTEGITASPVLTSSDRWYRTLTENIADAVVWVRDGEVVWASPSLTSTIGWTPEMWRGSRLAEFTHPDDRDDITAAWAGLVDGETAMHRFRVKSPDGHYHWVEGHARRFVNGDGHKEGFIETLRPIDSVIEAEQDLERRAKLDPLTGLLNRSEIMQRLNATKDHPRRTGGGMAVLFCDVDHLKPINDSFGHQVGDEVLKHVARRIQESVRTDDLAARVGGDEFVVLLTGIGGLEDAVAAAEKIRSAVSESIFVARRDLHPSLSIGIALVTPGANASDLLRNADAAMYCAKHAREQGLPLASADYALSDAPSDRALHVHDRATH